MCVKEWDRTNTNLKKLTKTKKIGNIHKKKNENIIKWLGNKMIK